MIELSKIAISLAPVLLFLLGMHLLDSFKLVNWRVMVKAILAGCLAAVVCLFLNRWLIDLLAVDLGVYSRYAAPFLEEITKAAFVYWQIRRRRVGFLVDSAILGFAVGAGFALVENAYYLHSLESSNLLLWVVRGVGTAGVHATTMVLFAVISKTISDRSSPDRMAAYIPGLVTAYLIHSVYNHFLLSPPLVTILLVVIMSLLVVVVFEHSERATRNWLGVGMDTDYALMVAIQTGKVLNTRVGKYLMSLNDHFDVGVVTDMLGLIRVNLQISLKVKGALMMREAGVRIDPDPTIEDQLGELDFYERSVGPAGLLALAPILRTRSRRLWEMHMITFESQ